MMRKKTWTALAVSLGVCLLAFLPGCSKGPAKAEIDVAVLAPLTGPAAEFSKYSSMGFDLAERDIKAAGHPALKVRYLDSKFNPKEAVSVLNQAILTKRPDVVVPMLSSIMKAVAPILEQQKLPVVANVVAAPNVAKPEAGVFRVFPSAEHVTEVAVTFAAGKGVKSFAVIHVNDEYGTSIKDTLTAHAAKAGISVVAAEPFSAVEKDFRTQWQRILANPPEAVFVAGNGPGYIAVLRQLFEHDYKGMVMVDHTLSAPFVMQAVEGVRDGVLMVSPAPLPEFEAKAKTVYPDAAYFVNIGTAYDTLRVIAAAAEGDPSQPLARRIAAVSLPDGAFGPVRFAENGDLIIPLSVFELRNGKLEKVQ